jgi:exonuclease SbcC
VRTPRWEHETSVVNALAPTTPRATVKLIFDLAEQRYVVAREVRRTKQGPQSRNLRLERYIDPLATGADTDITDPIAADRGVTPVVEKLLGLSFKQFCQCVVLPQGEFSRFLKAKPSERQDILLQLLGAEHYDQIGKLAYQRSRDADAHLDSVQERLEGLGDTSDEALAAAR